MYMFTNSEINFLAYRTDLSRPTPEKDLSTFIDQMQRVSVQASIVIKFLENIKTEKKYNHLMLYLFCSDSRVYDIISDVDIR